MKQSVTIFRSVSLFFLSFTLLLASCSKDKNDSVPAQASAFVGQYLVVDDNETYTMKVENKGGANFNITEFGGFLNVPLKAVSEGSTLKIPSQTFKNSNGKSITITGTGILLTKAKKDDTIKFDYAVTGFTEYEGDLEGTRQ